MADLADVCARYRKLYAGVIYDILSRHKLLNQVLSRHIRALRPDFVVAGPAMPFRGNVGPPEKGDFKIGQLIDACSEHCILVYAPGQEQESGHLPVLLNSGLSRGSPILLQRCLISSRSISSPPAPGFAR